MINSLTEDNKTAEKEKTENPDDLTGIYLRGFLKIVDPESGDVIVETAN